MRICALSASDHQGLPDEVSPFGDRRIKACLAAPRRLSQPHYVLHRLLESRHPPYTLTFLLGTVKITNPYRVLTHGKETLYIFDTGVFRKTASAIRALLA